MAVTGSDLVSEELDGESEFASFGFQQTLITGHYTRLLGRYGKSTAEEMKIHDAVLKKRMAKEKARVRLETSATYQYITRFQKALHQVIHKIGEDWVLLVIIGIAIAIIGYIMDFVASLAYRARIYTFDAAYFSPPLQYVIWVFYHSSFCMLSAGVVHLTNPQAAGSGMPEMKAILGGVELKDFLSWRSILGKFLAGCAAMSSGLPFGKGGVLACISACIAHLLCKRFTIFHGIYQNESRKFEMLAAAVAVAIACTFASPVSGVLFSIELTATFFEVQNYWRAFFCTICGTFLFRLIAVFVQYEMTISSLVKTTLNVIEFPYDILEFIPFSILGVVCGFGGALFVLVHRSLILFVRSRKKLSGFLQKFRLLYPFAVAALVATLTFPPLLGQYCGGRLNTRLVVTQLFNDKAFTLPLPDTATDEDMAAHATWSKPQTGGVFVNLALYCVIAFLSGALSYTVAVPFGIFTAVWAIGAALGRLFGEAMAVWYPQGINIGYGIYKVVPGGYAIVGASALSGGVLHAISVSLTLHEMTGQVNYLLPSLWATMIANIVAKALMPSMFDSIIQMKKIPFLPIFKPATSRAHYVYAEEIMQKDPVSLCANSTYDELKDLLVTHPFTRSFALVDTAESMVLIGSVQRTQLIDALEKHLKDSSESGDCTPAEGRWEGSKPSGKKKKRAKLSPNQVRDMFSHKAMEHEGLLLPEHEAHSQPPPHRRGSDVLFTLTEQEVVDQVADQASISTSPPPTSSGRHMPKRQSLSDFASVAAWDTSSSHSSSSRRRGSATSSTTPTATYGIDNRKRKKSGLVGKLPRAHSETEQMVLQVEEEEKRLLLEEDSLMDTISIDDLVIDPAPFQLSQRTSLHKIHSLFVLLCLSQAYVTYRGRLVGIVTIKEVQEELTHPSVHENPRLKLKRRHHKTASATIGGGDKGMPIILREDR